ncbi:hypothetical protein QUF72_17870 [Desulfobacterales bacterium HSG2]|nr:hypothetical protein [Desulfobacterales bacterium HSG2]
MSECLRPTHSIWRWRLSTAGTSLIFLQIFISVTDIPDLKKIIRLNDDLAIIQNDSRHIADIKAFSA